MCDTSDGFNIVEPTTARKRTAPQLLAHSFHHEGDRVPVGRMSSHRKYSRVHTNNRTRVYALIIILLESVR